VARDLHNSGIVRRMDYSSMDDYATRKRRAFRAGWLAALLNEPDCCPNHDDAILDSHWSDGFHEGNNLRQAWAAEKEAALARIRGIGTSASPHSTGKIVPQETGVPPILLT
jgi:hypothetical protein